MTDKKTDKNDLRNIDEKQDQKKSDNPAIKQKQADGEIGGPSGLEPTRYGDWERKGIVSDF